MNVEPTIYKEKKEKNKSKWEMIHLTRAMCIDSNPLKIIIGLNFFLCNWLLNSILLFCLFFFRFKHNVEKCIHVSLMEIYFKCTSASAYCYYILSHFFLMEKNGFFCSPYPSIIFNFICNCCRYSKRVKRKSHSTHTHT